MTTANPRRSRSRYNGRVQNPESPEQHAWSLAHAAAKALPKTGILTPAPYVLAATGELRAVSPDDPSAVLRWSAAAGWESLLPSEDPQTDLVELYLPVCSASAARPITVGHLGQSLDGFIATSAGDSCWVTGPENILHLHRLRALCDAVIVGAGTVEADNPGAWGPSKAARASLKSPLLTPFKYSQGISSSTVFVFRRYGGRILELKRSAWSAGRRSRTRGCRTSTGPIPVVIVRAGRWPLRTICR